MYTIAEYICTIIAILNCVAAMIIYIQDKRKGISVNSGKNFQSFKSCIMMSIMFGVASMCLTLNNLRYADIEN
ncbi:hypothetical protein Cantr_05282 [Candida viswanathii]|uniref:Uncharacterized protein n=1 Tax=Candida viswanathii TaxID=5486 RepID=A0A367XU85_9ASCO|nr:hypothetical protein Cantr_05282 [Candida viswanathii]